MLPFYYNNGVEIVQAPGYVVVRNEMVHEARVIPLDGRPHAGSAIRTWMGDSRGRWEGTTLVVETTNFNARVGVGPGDGGVSDPAPRPTGRLRISERFTRTDDETVEYKVTIEDPDTWTKPWTIAYPLRREANYQFLSEYACHEGNLFVHNVMSAARAQEQPSNEPPRQRRSETNGMHHLVASCHVVRSAAGSQQPHAVSAHHAFAAEFDINKPITLRGTVTKMDWINPHSWIHLEVTGADGKTVAWDDRTWNAETFSSPRVYETVAAIGNGDRCRRLPGEERREQDPTRLRDLQKTEHGSSLVAPLRTNCRKSNARLTTRADLPSSQHLSPGVLGMKRTLVGQSAHRTAVHRATRPQQLTCSPSDGVLCTLRCLDPRDTARKQQYRVGLTQGGLYEGILDAQSGSSISQRALFIVVVFPALCFAQFGARIAGVARDASGAVLPGVTVEATSPALIEKVRTAVTDGAGQYRGRTTAPRRLQHYV
jgi:hypothetical protein